MYQSHQNTNAFYSFPPQLLDPTPQFHDHFDHPMFDEQIELSANPQEANFSSNTMFAEIMLTTKNSMQQVGEGDGVGSTSCARVGRLSVEERKEKIERYRNKRHHRNFQKKITYACRKTLADRRPRVHGRFVRSGSFLEEMETKGGKDMMNYDWNEFFDVLTMDI